MGQEVVIIGAPRSGTNLLRDVLTKLPGVGTWPCDEINYIWRHGNVRYPSDEFVPSMATAKVCHYIRKQFAKIADREAVQTIVEKTCANSLRVGFVDRVLPEAKFVFIRRNGLDAVASAQHRWSASLDPVYIWNKARFVPLGDLPYYAFQYMGNRLYRLLSGKKRLASWGPKLKNMDELLEKYSLIEVCGLQWERCVNSAAAAFAAMPESKVIDVTYERFVSAPVEETARLAGFLGLSQKLIHVYFILFFQHDKLLHLVPNHAGHSWINVTSLICP